MRAASAERILSESSLEPVPLSKYKDESKYNSKFMKAYIRLARYCDDLVRSDSFNAFIISIIILAGFIVGIQTYKKFESDSRIHGADNFVLCIFACEVILKIIAEAAAPWRYFTGPEKGWNIFDLLIVFLSLPIWGSTFGGNSVKLLRLTRLMRVMKLVKKIPQLEMIVMGLIGGLRSIVYILALLMLVFYVYAILGYYMFSDNDNFHFGSVPISIITLFRMATLEDWTDVVYTEYYGCSSEMFDSYMQLSGYFGTCPSTSEQDMLPYRGLTIIYSVSFIVVSALVMLSLFVGAVTMSMTKSMAEMKFEREFQDRNRRRERAKKRAQRHNETQSPEAGSPSDGSQSTSETSHITASHLLMFSKSSSSAGSKTSHGGLLSKFHMLHHSKEDLKVDVPDLPSTNPNAPLPSSSSILDSTPLTNPTAETDTNANNSQDASEPTHTDSQEPQTGGRVLPHPPALTLKDVAHRQNADAKKKKKSNAVLPWTADIKEKSALDSNHKGQGNSPTPVHYSKDEKAKLETVLSLMHHDAPEQGGSRFKKIAQSAVKSIRERRNSTILWNPFAPPVPRREETERVRAAFKSAWEGVDFLEILEEDVETNYKTYFQRRYTWISNFSRHITEDPRFGHFITINILIAALMEGVRTEATSNSNLQTILTAIDATVVCVFFGEIILKTIAERFHPWRYFIRYGRIRGWNIFDYLVVVGSLIPGQGNLIKLLRLLRLMRVLKLVKSLPELQVIIIALIGGLTSISYIGVILFLVFYVFAILGMILFQESDPWHFGSLHISLFSLFRMATLEDWSDIMYINMYGCNVYGYSGREAYCVKPHAYNAVAAVYFVIFVLIGALVLMTLFIGVVTTSMEEATEAQRKQLEFAARVQHLRETHHISEGSIKAYERVFAMLDLDGSGTIEEEELRFGLMSIGRCPKKEDLDRMIHLIDEDGSGEIDFIEFCKLLVLIAEAGEGGSVLFKPDIAKRRPSIQKSFGALFGRNNSSSSSP